MLSIGLFRTVRDILPEYETPLNTMSLSMATSEAPRGHSFNEPRLVSLPINASLGYS